MAFALVELVLNRLWTGASVPSGVHGFASALVGSLSGLVLVVGLLQVARRGDVLPLPARALVLTLGAAFVTLAGVALVAPTARLQLHAELALSLFALGLCLVTLIAAQTGRARVAALLVTLPVALHGWASAAEAVPALALPLPGFAERTLIVSRLLALSCAVLLPSLLLPDLGAPGLPRGWALLGAFVLASWYGILHFMGHPLAAHAARALGLLPPATTLYALVQIAAVFTFGFVATALALGQKAARVTGTGLLLVGLAGLALGDAYQLLLSAVGLFWVCMGLSGVDELA